MFNLGLGEMVLIFVVALVVFGPDRLPELGKTFGEAVREFRKTSRDLHSELAEAVGKSGNNEREQD